MIVRNKNQAEQILSKIEDDSKHFYAQDGGEYTQLKDFMNALGNMNNETFEHHCNPSKNDFAQWIDQVVGDSTLAKSFKKLKAKDPVEMRRKMQQILKLRYNWLLKKAK